MKKNSFYSQKEIRMIGFRSVGQNILISKKASFYSPSTISIGDNVRIDDFCILSGNIKIGSFVHISAYVAIYGKGGAMINDYSGLSPRVTIFTEMDDFSGEFLIGPMRPKENRNIIRGTVKIEKYVQIGTGSVVFPKITIHEGVIVGALSLVKHDLNKWGKYAGIPAKLIGKRSKNLLKHI